MQLLPAVIATKAEADLMSCSVDRCSKEKIKGRVQASKLASKQLNKFDSTFRFHDLNMSSPINLPIILGVKNARL